MSTWDAALSGEIMKYLKYLGSIKSDQGSMSKPTGGFL
jgi:hypothetical protein